MLSQWFKMLCGCANCEARDIKPRYVIVPDGDKREYREKWNDLSYLEAVRLLKNNRVWNSELFSNIQKLRAEEEKATTPEEWRAKHEAVKAVQGLYLLPEEADRQIQIINKIRESKEKAGETDE